MATTLGAYSAGETPTIRPLRGCYASLHRYHNVAVGFSRTLCFVGSSDGALLQIALDHLTTGSGTQNYVPRTSFQADQSRLLPLYPRKEELAKHQFNARPSNLASIELLLPSRGRSLTTQGIALSCAWQLLLSFNCREDLYNHAMFVLSLDQ